MKPNSFGLLFPHVNCLLLCFQDVSNKHNRSGMWPCRFDLVILPAAPALMEPVMEVMAVPPLNYTSHLLHLAAHAWPGTLNISPRRLSLLSSPKRTVQGRCCKLWHLLGLAQSMLNIWQSMTLQPLPGHVSLTCPPASP